MSKLANIAKTPLKCPSCGNTDATSMLIYMQDWHVAGTLTLADGIRRQQPDTRDTCQCVGPVDEPDNPICNERFSLQLFIDAAQGIEVFEPLDNDEVHGTFEKEPVAPTVEELLAETVED